ncbi:hypothetical protein [Gordonia insulae]|uniref:Uncharacterized protein n=1 Tax=Gordonia insulae TaxID=2420509 RepID=A0A3G8JJA1_9ACTN|nr:hypothetical protein [Gordonia insulae]AZG44602.1 hypothetical protein D7316_01188 [Gordonia insulae]
MDIDEITDDLYGLDPGDFIGRRKDLVAEAKANGDPELAREIAVLRRPTQVAWAINQWARQDPDGVAAVLDLADQMLAAQRRSSADRLRELSTLRQQIVTDSTTAVVDVARTRGTTLSANAIREVGQSLRAAVADAEVADALRRGRLVTSAEYSGFGPAGVFVVPDAAETGPDPTDVATGEGTAPTDDDRSRATRVAAAAAVLATVAAAEQEARSKLAERDRERAAAVQRVDELVEQADRLRAELATCDAELRFARRQVDVADDEQRTAAQGLDDALDRVRQARRAVAEAEGAPDGG